MSNKDLYQILGVSRNADQSEIKKSYHKLAKQYHPDFNPNNPQAEAKFKEISAAFSVLSDEGKKKLYDEFGTDGLREGFNPEAARAFKNGGFGGGGNPFGGGFSFEDLLGSMFSGGGRGGNTRGAGNPFGGGHSNFGGGYEEAEDTETSVLVTLAQAIQGGVIPFNQYQVAELTIPPNTRAGQKLRLKGKGVNGGNLKIEVKITAPDGFKIEGDDLVYEAFVSLSEATLGASISIPNPDSAQELDLKIPAFFPIGKRMRLQNKGLPTKTGRGHLYVRPLIKGFKQTDDPQFQELIKSLSQYQA
jgi:molecular chaperone DnaJ